jgi:predicted nucleic acid-binding protein
VSFLPVYVDSSALLKLVLPEPERPELERVLSRWPDRISSVILAIECQRIARRAGVPKDLRSRLDGELETVALIRLDEPVQRLAGSIGSRDLRSLDAIHLATALSCGDYPEAFITYDDRLAAAARTLHLNVLQPGR